MIGEEFVLRGKLVRVVDETRVTSITGPLDEANRPPLSFIAQLVEPVKVDAEADQEPLA